MQRHSNPSNIKIQMNNFTLNLQTLLSKEDQKLLPTTNRKHNKTERANTNHEEVSPLKVKKKTKEKDFVVIRKKTKKQNTIEEAKVNSKQTLKTNNEKKDKKQIDPIKKVKKIQQKNSQHRSKSKNHKSTRLQKHFTDHDHVIQSARLRTSPSQHVNYQKFNSESISKSISRSRSKSFSKLQTQKQKHTKSRSKSIFSSNNEKLNTQRSVSKIKKAKQKQTLQTEKSTEKLKGRKSSKSRQRKSIDNLTKVQKSKSRERIYTQVSDRHAIESNHLKSDLVMMEREEKALLSHKKKKPQHYRQQSENLMSHSSDNGVLGPKFASTKFNHSKERVKQKSPTKAKGKKLQATLSTTSIHPKTKKSTASKKQPSSKVSKKQSSIKQKSSIQSQFNFYQSTNLQKKKLTEEDLNDFFQKSTQKKVRKLKTEADGFVDGGVLSMKRNVKGESEQLLLQKAFKKKKVKNVVEKLFEEQNRQMVQKKVQIIQSRDNQPNNNYKPHPNLPYSQSPQQVFSRTKLLHTKKLTIQTQFNPTQKEIYFDDISKILHKHKRTESISEESRHSICRSERSIKEEIMQNKHQSGNCQWEEKGRRLEELVKGSDCVSREDLGERERDVGVVGDKGKGREIRYDQDENEEREERMIDERMRNEEIRRINTEELEESDDEEESDQNQGDQNQEDEDEQQSDYNSQNQDSQQDQAEKNLITQKIPDQLQQLQQLNSQLQTMIKDNSISQQKPLPSQSKTSHNRMHHAKSSSLIQQSHKSDNFNPVDQMIGQQKIIKNIKTFHSSQFLQQLHKRTPINSPSSYALQNKQKVLFSLNKPRKSIEEQFKIAKTLSNKKLLEELELLNVLEKIEKSVENSLVLQNGEYHLVLGGDKIVEQKVVDRKFEDEVKHSVEVQQVEDGDDGLRTAAIGIKPYKQPPTTNPTLPTIHQLQTQLILTSQHHNQSPCQYHSNKSSSSRQSLNSMLKLLPCQYSNKQKEDSPLLSSCEQQFKRSSPINIFDSLEYISLKGFAEGVIKQMQIQPFQVHSGDNVEKVQGKNVTEQQHSPDQFISSTKQSTIIQPILINAQQTSHQQSSNSQKNSTQARRGDYSQLSLQFQRQMEDYLRDNQKSILVPTKNLAVKTLHKEITKTHSDNEQQPKEYSSAHSDEFFYHKGTPLPLPSSKPTLPQPPITEQNHSQLIKTQLINHITDTLIQQFTLYLNNNKLALHKFLYYASCLNVEQLQPFAQDQNTISEINKRKPVFDPFQALQHKQVHEEEFMQYLQARIQASNSYIFNLANDLFQFVKKSPQLQMTFITNINKSFGLKPLKTLKWMRKAFSDNDQQEEVEEEEERQQQSQDQVNAKDNQNDNQNDQEEQLSDSMSQNQQLEAVLSPMLLADFDAAQNEIVFQQINQQQYYLNHAVYATLNQICDSYRPYGENGPPVIPKHHPHVNTSVALLQPKVMHRLNSLLSLRMGRTQFSPDQEPQKIIPQTYRRMDELIVGEQHEKWNQRNLQDLVFESKYYLAMYIVDLVFNQEVMEMFRLLV